ncbi:hypothetical protein BEH_07630 [Priestia filamentosa]|uniref:Uncharacterized protein n=1 Tax=Priestia filamentosa TaxID=1402861 RepID=A0A0H4KED3_9BACI|nr:hypothetical protein [Priestia filamentosa]AKO91980.1 hypothetical protein BEH_07630 [Priestia filamentosa]
MKAFEVHYQTPRKSTMVIILSKTEEGIENNLIDRDAEYKKYKGKVATCKINSHKEIPLSNVLVSHLSVVDLMKLLKEEK